MSTLSKKLFISVLALIMTVGAFTATTFAWFTLGDSATITAFEAEVAAGEGLEIQVEGGASNGGWFNVISNTELNPAIGDPFLRALQTKDLENFTFLSDEVAVAGTDFIEFQLNFRTTKENPNKILKWNAASLSGDLGTFLADIEFLSSDGTTTISLNDPYSISAAFAARIAVVGISTGAKAVAYERQNDPVSILGTPTVSNTLGYSDNEVGAHSYWLTKNPGSSLAVDIAKQNYTTSDINTTREDVVELVVASGEDYAEGSVMVRVWIDGWDVDAFNAIFALKLMASLSFTLIPA